MNIFRWFSTPVRCVSVLVCQFSEVVRVAQHFNSPLFGSSRLHIQLQLCWYTYTSAPSLALLLVWCTTTIFGFSTGDYDRSISPVFTQPFAVLSYVWLSLMSLIYTFCPNAVHNWLFSFFLMWTFFFEQTDSFSFRVVCFRCSHHLFCHFFSMKSIWAFFYCFHSSCLLQYCYSMPRITFSIYDVRKRYEFFFIFFISSFRCAYTAMMLTHAHESFRACLMKHVSFSSYSNALFQSEFPMLENITIFVDF